MSIHNLDTINVNTVNLNSTAITATGLEINQLCDNSARFQAGGTALTLTAASHGGKIIQLDTAAGTTITLPAATGSGTVFKFLVTVLATSNSHIIQTSAGTEHMQGIVHLMDDTSDNSVAFAAVSGTSDTITLNRSTTGSVTIGEVLILTDVASTLWLVEGTVSNTGTPATPFSAAV